MGQKSKKRKNNTSDSGYNQLGREVVNFLNKNSHKEYSYKHLLKKLHLKNKIQKQQLEMILEELAKEKKIALSDTGTYQSAVKVSTVEGKVDFVNPRYAYVVSDQSTDDIYVRSEDMSGALDDDMVKVKIRGFRKDGRPFGEVTEVIQRFRDEFVGRLQLSRDFGFVIPDFKKMHADIYIDSSGLGDAKNNDKVIVRITEWATRKKNPKGKIVRVLGQAGENEAEIHSIMAEFGLPFHFDDRLIIESKKISPEITGHERERRLDFRNTLTFTIDPEDAKDFDDAISFRILEDGHFEVGVHIADVSHYVNENTEMDKEAYQRGTSVYLVDRTIPMLPEHLSNDLCSLRPEEDKLTFSAVFEMDHEARIRREWFGKTIIHSRRRFTYEEAQERIENRSGDYAHELEILNELALKLRLDRFKRGSINFESPEVKFRLGEQGEPLDVIPKDRKDAHKLIEDFMLLANRRVAEFIFKNKKEKEPPVFVYRIHDEPDQEKLLIFENFARKFGYKLNINQQGISKALNNLLDDIQGKPEQNVLENLAIRSMAKAKYSTAEKGHFGLAFLHYTHFTSPIRRYPDLMVHRLLSHYLSKGKSVDREKFEKKCLHCSEREKVASDAERASIKFKQVEFMQKHIGEIFEGLISGITDWGIFVEIIKFRCEGMVRLSSLSDDYYVFDEKNYRITGRNNKKMFTLGDHILVQVVSTDIDRRTIDLNLAEEND